MFLRVSVDFQVKSIKAFQGVLGGNIYVFHRKTVSYVCRSDDLYPLMDTHG